MVSISRRACSRASAVRQIDIEELALAHCGDAVVAQPVERRAHGLALRIQHRGLEGNKDACFHGRTSIIAWRAAERPAACIFSTKMTLSQPLRRGIGVFDSGVGGLTVLQALRRQMPQRDFVYLGDTARVPYGRKPPEMVVDFAMGIAEFLCGMGDRGAGGGLQHGLGGGPAGSGRALSGAGVGRDRSGRGSRRRAWPARDAWG